MPRDVDEAKEIEERLARMRHAALTFVARIEAVERELRRMDPEDEDEDDEDDAVLTWAFRRGIIPEPSRGPARHGAGPDLRLWPA